MMLTNLKEYEGDFCYQIMITFANTTLNDIERERCIGKAFQVYSEQAKIAHMEKEVAPKDPERNVE